jgi:hypothetical protein
MLLEIFTIFLPCWEVVKHQSLRQETLESIARWEARNKEGGSQSLGSSTSSYVSWKKPRGKKAGSISSSNSSVLTMDALEHTLTKNPEPLQHFSALKDFSGENIAFLMRVAQWRNKFYIKKKASNGASVEIDSRESFQEALRIYIDFISSRGAEFQINLSSHDFKNLEAIFEPAARVVYGDEKTPDPATPFETADWRVGPNDNTSNSSQTAITKHETTISGETCLDSVRYWGEIPATFTESVFDDAETSIKYLVLTNTWPKFVKARRSMDSIEALEANAASV